MSKFDVAPTRLLSAKNKKANDQTESDTPTININQESVDFRPEEGAIAGGNLNQLEVEAQAPAINKNTGGNTVLVRRSAEIVEKPTVGWLIIIAGAGKGQSVAFSYGLNKIGRDEGQDIALNFGDEAISRIAHAAIEFDPKPRQFYLSKGENLVYLNGERVGAGGEKVLKMGDEIILGDTTLRFVPFCDKNFDWLD